MSDRPHRARSVVLWVLATLLTLSAAVYQRLTGPTYPVRGTVELSGGSLSYRLIRTHETTAPATIQIPDPQGLLHGAVLRFRRFPTDEPLEAVPMRHEETTWSAELPPQPAAGKMEYVVELLDANASVRLPEGGDMAVLRYKDPVSTLVLLPHVLFMFFGMLLGVRAALSAGFETQTMKRWALGALGCLTIGGLVLGPLVQKAAFDAYWTGWPFGQDPTDNKTLLLWGGWVVASVAVLRKEAIKAWWSRLLVIAACVIMLGVYMIPHSVRGSQLDYDALDAGARPADAVEVGR